MLIGIAPQGGEAVGVQAAQPPRQLEGPANHPTTAVASASIYAATAASFIGVVYVSRPG